MRLFFLCGGFFFFILSGCNKYYLTIEQEWVDRRYLASERVNTPDPRRDHPPQGQMLILSWRIPKALFAEKPHIVLEILFRDFTTISLTIPVKSPMGDETYTLLNEAFQKTRGLLAYKAYLVTENGIRHYLWQHQLWVEPVHL